MFLSLQLFILHLFLWFQHGWTQNPNHLVRYARYFDIGITRRGEIYTFPIVRRTYNITCSNFYTKIIHIDWTTRKFPLIGETSKCKMQGSGTSKTPLHFPPSISSLLPNSILALLQRTSDSATTTPARRARPITLTSTSTWSTGRDLISFLS